MHNVTVPDVGELLSREDEQALLEETLLHRLPHRNVLFKPTTSFYNQLSTEEGIVHAIREIYQWLGSKPTKIHVTLVESNVVEQTDSTIRVPRGLLAHPYQLASSLTLVVLQHCLERRLKQHAPQTLAETASIESGLGVIILNGIAERPTTLGWWHHGIKKQQPHFQVLEAYSAASYARLFSSFCHASSQDGKIVMAQLSKNAGQLMPPYYQHQAVKPRSAPQVIRQANQKTHRTALRLVMSSTVVALVCGLGLFIYAQRPFSPDKAEQAQFTKTQVLAKSYAQCQAAAKKRQDAYKQNDIFEEQDINAALTSCQSIRNEYNYEVANYNALLENHN